mmetsp:Transcript_12966/g.25348  ORF Transcript_12966/g.25348 Transcript_12966/m.25348 type:complete len:131 (+) Transcript_12966:721-1113(+)
MSARRNECMRINSLGDCFVPAGGKKGTLSFLSLRVGFFVCMYVCGAAEVLFVVLSEGLESPFGLFVCLPVSLSLSCVRGFSFFRPVKVQKTALSVHMLAGSQRKEQLSLPSVCFHLSLSVPSFVLVSFGS